MDRELNTFLKIVVFVLVLTIIYTIFNSNTENLENVEMPVMEMPMDDIVPEMPVMEMPMEEVVPVMEETPTIDMPPSTDLLPPTLNPTQELTTNDLLPVYNEASEFVKNNPVSDLLKEQNFLVSSYHIGINTVLQSNKIPYHDLRSAPPIPKQDLGPFNNSSIESPMGSSRRFFELGSY
jgi:hypothetical protein